MIKFEKITPGMQLWDVRKATGYQAYKRKWDIWGVKVIEVDAEKRRALVSWNSNKAEWMPEHRVTQYRAKQPK